MPAQADTALQTMPLDDLERDIAGLGAGLAERLARWLALVGEFDRRAAARRRGFRGTAEWLAWRCDIDRRTARAHVHVARRLAELPEVRAAFAAGELSYSKVRAISRARADEDEPALLAMAQTMTADRLERSVRALRGAPSADAETALERRDGGCRFPACDRRHGLHAHHVTHWAHGGPTDRDNLVLLCRFHHRLVHEDGFHVEAIGGAFRFLRPDGRELGDRPPPVAEAA